MKKELFPHTEREDILRANSRREEVRQKLKSDAEQAREDLSPRNQVNRLVTRSKERLDNAAVKAGKTVRRAAPAIGLASVGTLLFLGRKPISRWISHLRKDKER